MLYCPPRLSPHPLSLCNSLIVFFSLCLLYTYELTHLRPKVWLSDHSPVQNRPPTYTCVYVHAYLYTHIRVYTGAYIHTHRLARKIYSASPVIRQMHIKAAFRFFQIGKNYQQQERYPRCSWKWHSARVFQKIAYVSASWHSNPAAGNLYSSQ